MEKSPLLPVSPSGDVVVFNILSVEGLRRSKLNFPLNFLFGFLKENAMSFFHSVDKASFIVVVFGVVSSFLVFINAFVEVTDIGSFCVFHLDGSNSFSNAVLQGPFKLELAALNFAIDENTIFPFALVADPRLIVDIRAFSVCFAFAEAAFVETIFSDESAFDVGKDSVVFVRQSGSLVDHVGCDKANGISLLIVDKETIAVKFPLGVSFVFPDLLLQQLLAQSYKGVFECRVHLLKNNAERDQHDLRVQAEVFLY